MLSVHRIAIPDIQEVGEPAIQQGWGVMRIWIIMSVALLIGLLTTQIAQAEQNNTLGEENPFPDMGQLIGDGIRKALHSTVDGAVNIFTGSGQRIIGWKDVHVPGKPLKECLRPDKELNEEVLRCRNGYTQRVPIYSQ